MSISLAHCTTTNPPAEAARNPMSLKASHVSHGVHVLIHIMHEPNIERGAILMQNQTLFS